jgi:hypothetical protein
VCVLHTVLLLPLQLTLFFLLEFLLFALALPEVGENLRQLVDDNVVG